VSRIQYVSAVILSGGVCLACLYLLSRLDFEAVLFIRSLDFPFVEQLGNVGNRLGDGVTLVILCAGLWGVGWLLHRQTYQQAGRDAFVAYVLAGLLTQLFKHLIGRPRPRFAHQGAFDYGPSLQGGLDAFPSGHTSASFAVAAVLARVFPAWAWAWYGGAVFVGLSRFVRGSHFPTDVLGGAVLGFLVGYIWARPLAEWRHHATRVWTCMLPFVVGGCAMFWNVFSRPAGDSVAWGMFWAGLLLCTGGIVARWVMACPGHGLSGSWADPSARRPVPRPAHATIVIVLGLAVSLQTIWIVAVTLMTCLVWWMLDQPDHHPPEAPRVSREVWLTGGWVIVVAAAHGLQGIVPLH